MERAQCVKTIQTIQPITTKTDTTLRSLLAIQKTANNTLARGAIKATFITIQTLKFQWGPSKIVSGTGLSSGGSVGKRLPGLFPKFLC